MVSNTELPRQPMISLKQNFSITLFSDKFGESHQIWWLFREYQENSRWLKSVRVPPPPPSGPDRVNFPVREKPRRRKPNCPKQESNRQHPVTREWCSYRENVSKGGWTGFELFSCGRLVTRVPLVQFPLETDWLQCMSSKA